MAKVGSYNRTVNGRRQRVKSHNRKLQPARARANVRRASMHGRSKRYGTAAALVGVAAAEVGAWTALRGASLVLVTIGIVAVGAGVAARRATPSTPRPVRRSPGTVRPAPRQAYQYKTEADGTITVTRPDGTRYTTHARKADGGE